MTVHTSESAQEASGGDPGAGSVVPGLFDRTEPQNGSDVPAYVWGVDVSTRRVAIAAAGPEPEVVSVEWDPGLKTGARLAALYSAVWLAAVPFSHRRPPLYVFVEQPAAFGHHVEPELMYAVGTAQAALYGCLQARFAHPVEVRTIPIGTWKKHGVGHGGAKKPAIMAWAWRNGYQGDCQDEADAWGIAHAGARLIAPQPEQLELAG